MLLLLVGWGEAAPVTDTRGTAGASDTLRAGDGGGESRVSASGVSDGRLAGGSSDDQ